LDSVSNNFRFKNADFLFDPSIKQIGMVTDEYVYVHNLISGKEDFRSSKDNLPLASTAAVEEDKKTLQSLSQAYYETAKYMLYHNKKIIAK
jgi:hypothetical protein